MDAPRSRHKPPVPAAPIQSVVAERATLAALACGEDVRGEQLGPGPSASPGTAATPAGPDPRQVRSVVDAVLVAGEGKPPVSPDAVLDAVELAAWRLLKPDYRDPRTTMEWHALVRAAAYAIGVCACWCVFREQNDVRGADAFLRHIRLARYRPRWLREEAERPGGSEPESVLREAAFIVLRGSDATAPENPIAAWERAPEPGALQGYLRAGVIRAARNIIRDRQQTDDMRRKFEEQFPEEPHKTAGPRWVGADEVGLSAEAGPEALDEVALNTELASLPARTERVLRLYGDGWTQGEIARDLGITQGRVSQILKAAFGELRRRRSA